MSMALEPENPFWRFSLATYAKPGVEQECLALQRERGINVNLLLFAAWCGSEGKRLRKPDLERCEAVIRAWQRDVVKPLREARTHLKKLSDYDPAAVPALRKDLAAAELRAEQIEQAILFAEAAHLDLPVDSDREGAVRSNLDLFLAPADCDHRAAAALIAALQ